MNKKLIFGFISTLLIISWFSCDDDSSKPDETVSVEKKLIHIKEQWVHPPPAFDTLLFSFREEYDRAGNMLEQKKYTIAGPLAYHTKIKYNEQGDEILKTIYDATLDSTKTYKSQVEYRDGKKYKVSVNSPDGSYHSIYSHAPDSSYQLVTFSEGKKVGESSYSKDNKILSSYLSYNKHSELYTYNDQGDLALRVRKIDEQVRDSFIFRLDYYKSGQLKETDVRGRRHVFTYNENGDIETETWYRNGNLSRVIKYKYEYY